MSRGQFVYATLHCMRRKKRPFLFLVISLLSLIGLSYLAFSFPPNWKFAIGSPVGELKLEILLIFFTLLFLSVSSLASYLLNNVRRGVLVSVFTTTYFLFRLFHLTHPLFLVLLLGLFITIELFFNQRH